MKDKSTLYILYRVVEESNFEKIVNAKNSRKVSKILKKVYKGNKCVR